MGSHGTFRDYLGLACPWALTTIRFKRLDMSRLFWNLHRSADLRKIQQEVRVKSGMYCTKGMGRYFSFIQVLDV